MKRGKLFYLLITLSLIFAACDKSDKSRNDIPNKESYDEYLEAKYLLVEYWGDEFTPGIDNYSIIIAEEEFKMSLGGESLTEGSYYCIDLYAPATEDGNIPEGTYTFDASDSGAEWTIYGALIMVDADGNFITDEEGILFSEATLVIGENSAVLTAIIEGKSHYVTFTGKFAHIDSTNEGGDVIRQTTLINDVEVEGDTALFVAEQLEDSTYILVMVDNRLEGVGGSAIFMLDIALAEGSDTISGTYSVADETLSVGTYDSYGMWGSWYFTTDDDGDLGPEYAAIYSGSVTFVQEGDTCTMQLDCSDVEGYSIKATLSGEFISESFAPEALTKRFNR